MRTKAMLQWVLLGALASVSAVAQTNTNVTITIYPGFNIISCPLIASPDNTINTLLNNGGSQPYTGTTLDFFSPITGPTYDTAAATSGRNSTPNTNGWVNNGTNVI